MGMKEIRTKRAVATADKCRMKLLKLLSLLCSMDLDEVRGQLRRMVSKKPLSDSCCPST